MTKTDREQVQELMSLYANALDTKDYAGIGDCFTPDATAEYAGFAEPLHGREAILAHMRKALEPLESTQHLFANFIIDVDGDAGTLSCAIIAQHVRRGHHDTFLAGGQYKVEVARGADRWRMSRVDARSRWGMGDRGMLPKAG
jgi:hypothetical protein